MNLFELFDQEPNKNTVTDRLTQIAVDFLIPLVAQKVPFVTIQQMIDKLRDSNPGLLVDRALVTNILDPQKIKSIASIEGDHINLQQPMEDEHKVDDNKAEQEIDKIKNMAKQKAMSDVKDK